MESRTVGVDELEAMILSGELRDAPSVAALGPRAHAECSVIASRRSAESP